MMKRQLCSLLVGLAACFCVVLGGLDRRHHRIRTGVGLMRLIRRGQDLTARVLYLAYL